MYPNDPDNPQPVGIDYLNEIAPPPPPAGFDRKTKIILVIFGIIGVLSLVLIFVMANQTNPGPTPIKLAARLQKLQTISTNYTKKLKSGDLQAANSSLTSILTTANQQIATPLAAYDIDAKKQAKEIAALDPSTEIEARLDDAYLNSVLDNAYAQEMNVQLSDTILMMQRLERTTRVKSMQEFLSKNLADFKNLQKRFAEIAGT